MSIYHVLCMVSVYVETFREHNGQDFDSVLYSTRLHTHI
jgi:hypothetical protein